MKILKNWKKFNEDNHGTGNATRDHFEKNKKEIENIDFVLYKNGVYSIELNLNLREIGADMEIPNIKSSSSHPYCLVSKDKTLLYKLQEYLKGLEFDDFNGVEWHDTRSFNNAVCPFQDGKKESPFITEEPTAKPMMSEITKEDLRYPSRVNNNVIVNDELYNRCKENMRELPEGKAFSYFEIFSYDEQKHIVVGIDVTEGLKKLLSKI
jgi:hypothetical protein